MIALRILALAAFALAAPAVAQAGEVECAKSDLEGLHAFRLPAHAELPEGGTDVRLKVDVRADGSYGDVRLYTSSGKRSIDHAVLEAFRQTRLVGACLQTPPGPLHVHYRLDLESGAADPDGIARIWRTSEEDEQHLMVNSCNPDGSQLEINYCAVAEAAQAWDLLQDVLGEIEDTYSGFDMTDQMVAMQSAQDGWRMQMEAEMDALYPLEPGQHPSEAYGSSYLGATQLLRAALYRQRVAVLCDAWLPSQVRRKPPRDAASVCSPIEPISVWSTPVNQARLD